MKCYFCGSKYVNKKVKFIGKQNGKRRQKTANVCYTCSAMADGHWFEKKLDLDEGSLKVKGVD